MKLYTKGGDDGTTGLLGGRRVSKSDARIRACGEIDETSAAIGLAVASRLDEPLNSQLRQVQADLFALGARLADPSEGKTGPGIDDDAIKRLESWIDAACGEVPALKNFILPGGIEAGARLHLARAICRRAERAVVALAETESVARQAIVYVNRLSDLLFALARQANHRAGAVETPWPAPQVRR